MKLLCLVLLITMLAGCTEKEVPNESYKWHYRYTLYINRKIIRSWTIISSEPMHEKEFAAVNIKNGIIKTGTYHVEEIKKPK